MALFDIFFNFIIFLAMKIAKVLVCTLIFFFLFPIENFIKIEPYLILKIDKNNEQTYNDEYYIHSLGKLKKLYFRKKDRVIFFDNTGKIIQNYRLSEEYIIDAGTGENGVLCYLKDGDKIYLLDRKKGVRLAHQAFGYPFMSLNNKWILILTGENGAFSVIDTNGNQLSDLLATGSLLISFDFAYYTNLIITGYINGVVSLYNTELKLFWDKKIDDSKIPLIKKVKISPDGRYISVLAGLDKEKLYLLNNEGKIIYKHTTFEERRRPAEMYFSMNNKFLLEESETGFRVYSLEKNKLLLQKNLFKKDPKRKMISMDISNDGKFILVSYYENTDISIVELYSKDGVMLFRLFFESSLPRVLFSFDKNAFLIETADKIFVYGF